jgi:hypothetical protein
MIIETIIGIILGGGVAFVLLTALDKCKKYGQENGIVEESEVE